jgi:hypothetical protein
MTEQEWLKCQNPDLMLQYLARKRDKRLLRKFRLFCCAVCRRAWPLLTPQGRKALDMAEGLIDRPSAAAQGRLEKLCSTKLSTEEWERAGHAVSDTASRFHTEYSTWGVKKGLISIWAFQTALIAKHVVSAVTGNDSEQDGYVGWRPQITARWKGQGRAERKKVAALLRHIVGNPFRPYPAPPSWPSAVVQLAESLYDGQDCAFALHDALLEAGRAELAEHFREEKSHPKGCWAMDLVLGKS